MDVTEIYGSARALSAEQMLRRLRSVLYMIVGSWALVLIARLIPVGGRWLPIEGMTTTVLLAWPALFAISYLLAAGPLRSRAASNQQIATPRTMTNIALAMSAIGAAGAMLIIFDFAFLRGYGFATSAAIIRAEEGTAAIRGLSVSSPVAGAGRLMLPAIFIAVGLLAANFRHMPRWSLVATILSIMLVAFEQAAFEGGRTIIATMILVAVISSYLLSDAQQKKKKVRRTSLSVVALVSAVGVAMAYFTFYIFISRIMERNDFFWSSYLNFTRDFTIYVDSDYLSRLEGFFGGFWYGIDMLWLYITQGVNELDLLLSQPDIPLAYGTYQFPQLASLASVMIGVDIKYDVYTYLPNAGTYLTIYGANYVDFGHGGAILSAVILGVATAWTAHSTIRRTVSAAALCGPMLVTVGLFSPVISVLTTVWPAFFWAIGISLVLSQSRQIGRKALS